MSKVDKEIVAEAKRLNEIFKCHVRSAALFHAADILHDAVKKVYQEGYRTEDVGRRLEKKHAQLKKGRKKNA